MHIDLNNLVVMDTIAEIMPVFIAYSYFILNNVLRLILLCD